MIKIFFKAGNYEIIESLSELKNYDNVISFQYIDLKLISVKRGYK